MSRRSEHRSEERAPWGGGRASERGEKREVEEGKEKLEEERLPKRSFTSASGSRSSLSRANSGPTGGDGERRREDTSTGSNQSDFRRKHNPRTFQEEVLGFRSRSRLQTD